MFNANKNTSGSRLIIMTKLHSNKFMINKNH
ncbi:Hypothetical protein PAU_01041 [Photorhabdus asymbiotica]|uniref:Uncharacterized protein n=1 Tax=Photorhabdus asymbiotica subsp. asymbiotica (strain ATCC 43949 / 3105-77) TaxID=553480 RepID=B6VK45_PHOAA|nr:Hypothetical protein PAU_01041 [Photorhabdus asymbiotica]CAR66525.1 Hypothetical protein PA-RVA1-4444 [Photorhabdus asymbiotica subsp. asymbiotica ATCC 43949]